MAYEKKCLGFPTLLLLLTPPPPPELGGIPVSKGGPDQGSGPPLQLYHGHAILLFFLCVHNRFCLIQFYGRTICKIYVLNIFDRLKNF